MISLINCLSSDPKTRLILQCKTWTRDSHGLFDYECNITNDSSFNISKDILLIRSDNNVKIVDANNKKNKEEEVLGNILFENQSKKRV